MGTDEATHSHVHAANHAGSADNPARSIENVNEDYRDILLALVARNARIEESVEGVRVPVLSLTDLVENKRATGRDKDRADIKGLEGKS